MSEVINQYRKTADKARAFADIFFNHHISSAALRISLNGLTVRHGNNKHQQHNGAGDGQQPVRGKGDNCGGKRQRNHYFFRCVSY